jgi:hypothetical protein
VLAAVLHNLCQAGLSPVHSKHDVYTAPMPARKLNEHSASCFSWNLYAEIHW